MAPDDATVRPPVRALRSYLHDPGMTPGSAAGVLRGAFLAVFAGQVAVATLVAGVLTVVAGRQDGASGWVAAVTLLGSLGQVLLGIGLTAAGVRQTGRAARRLRLDRPDAGEPGDEEERPDDGPERRLRVARTAAMSNALLSAVLLSTPAWFGAFAWVTGQTAATLVGIAGLTMTGYAFGVLQLGPLARAVTLAATATPAPSERTPDADEARPDPLL